MTGLASKGAVALLISWSIQSSTCFTPSSFGGVSMSRQSTKGQGRAFRSRGLFGIMDEVNSDSYDLLGSSSSKKDSPSKDITDAYEVFLADLVFSPNDPRLDIVEKIDLAGDDNFLDWLLKKAETSTDPDERLALKNLLEMIQDIKQKMELSLLAEQRKAKEKEEQEQAQAQQQPQPQTQDQTLSDTDVLRKAAQVDMGGVNAIQNEQADFSTTSSSSGKSFIDQELSPEIRMSYETLVQKLLPPYKPGESPASVVYNNYDQCDAQLIKVLKERAVNGDQDSQAVMDAIAQEQSKRMVKATERLKQVLSSGDPMRMEGAIVKLARDGHIDEPFLLLLEANANQAQATGATGPAQLMTKLKNRALEEKDKQTTSKEVLLLRRLLRTENAEEREKILEDAFTPREKLLVKGTAENAAKAVDGEAPEQEKPMPDVAPPDFINACKAVTINFGNVATEEKGDLTAMMKTIAAEAEVVATRIYGKGMTPKEQQDRMYKEQTTSIFDLERMEIEAEKMGEMAPWGNPNNDDILPGFDKDGRMKVGGG